MNDLEKYFYANKDRVIHKFPHYFEIYDRYFDRFRNRDLCVVEIGIGEGGSLQMWKNYFGKKAEIIGVDISTDAQIKEDGIRVIHGDQGDLKFLKELPGKIGRPIDILIDDGSHCSKDQILTFNAMYPHISSYGIYLCEDLQTSYQPQFGGSFKQQDTFIELMKDKIDELNGWCAEPDSGQKKTEFTKESYAIHFYTYMVVVLKMPMDSVLRSPVVSGGIHV